MTASSADVPVLAFDEPGGLTARGTVVVLPGRGERPGLYERFGRRLAADAWRVRVVGDATEDLDEVVRRVRAALGAPGRARPSVLVGSDTGALLALRLAARAEVAVDGLVLAGLPDPDRTVAVTEQEEPELRASCPTHQSLLRDAERELFTPGTLAAGRIPDALREPVLPESVVLPVLGLHGDDDRISPPAQASAVYRKLPAAQLVTVLDGRHDVLNAAHHRSVAATVVLWLERLRLGADLPVVARAEPSA